MEFDTPVRERRVRGDGEGWGRKDGDGVMGKEGEG